jgi:hypothetical protein
MSSMDSIWQRASRQHRRAALCSVSCMISGVMPFIFFSVFIDQTLKSSRHRRRIEIANRFGIALLMLDESGKETTGPAHPAFQEANLSVETVE